MDGHDYRLVIWCDLDNDGKVDHNVAVHPTLAPFVGLHIRLPKRLREQLGKEAFVVNRIVWDCDSNSIECYET